MDASIGSIVNLVATCEWYIAAHGPKNNCKNCEVLIFKFNKYNPKNVPLVVLVGTALRVIDRFKYLGDINTYGTRDLGTRNAVPHSRYNQRHIYICQIVV